MRFASDRVDTFDPMPDKISIKAAARVLEVPEHSLYARASEGVISVERRTTGRTRALVELDICRREVAALRCQAPGCEQPAHRAGEFCSHACSVRKYAPETRLCKQCGESFAVEGHRTRDNGGKGQEFCRPACVAQWRWEHEPESFPQSQRRGEVKTCPICGETRYRPPSHQHLIYCAAPCAHEGFRRWLATSEGRAHREDLEAAQKAWWKGVKAAAEAEAKAAGRLLTDELVRECGVPSLPTVTRDLPQRGVLRREKDSRGFVTVPIRDAAKLQQQRLGTTALFGRYAPVLAAEKGNKVGPRVKLAPEEEALIRELHASGLTQGQIVIKVGCTRKQVRRVLAL